MTHGHVSQAEFPSEVAALEARKAELQRQLGADLRGAAVMAMARPSARPTPLGKQLSSSLLSPPPLHFLGLIYIYIYLYVCLYIYILYMY